MSLIALCFYAFFITYAFAQTKNLIGSNDDFEETMRINKAIAVLYYDPTSVVSKDARTNYVRAVQALEERKINCTFFDLDVNRYPAVANMYHIRNTPHLKLYINHREYNYSNNVNKDYVMKFVKERIAPQIYEMTLDELREDEDNHGLRSILISDDEEIIQNYMEASLEINDIKLYRVSEEIGKEVFPDIETFPHLIMRMDFDQGEATMTKELTTENIKSFLSANKYPTVVDYDLQTNDKLLMKKDYLLYSLFINTTKDDSKKIISEYRKFAKAKRWGRVVFTLVGDTPYQISVKKKFGIEDKDTPILEILEMNESQQKFRYRFNGTFNLASFIDFYDNYEAQKLDRLILSEEIPKESQGPIYKLVAKNYRQEVMDNKLDVLVFIYGDECPSCGIVRKAYEKVAKIFGHYKTLKFYELDYYKNDVEGLPFIVIPKVRLYPGKAKNKPVQLNTMTLTVDDLLEFIIENSTATYTKPTKFDL